MEESIHNGAEVIAELEPWVDELVLAKSSSSPFSSTSLDYLLRNIGICSLVVIGMLTDQCIDHTVKDAADRGYRVVYLTDACQAETPECHQSAWPASAVKPHRSLSSPLLQR